MTDQQLARNILDAARRRLTDPARWNKGFPTDYASCAAIAMSDIAHSSIGCEAPLVIAMNVLLCAIGESTAPSWPGGMFRIARWNDNPATTHEDVLAALDRARAALS